MHQSEETGLVMESLAQPIQSIKQPVYKQWWFWLITAGIAGTFLLCAIVSCTMVIANSQNFDTGKSQSNKAITNKPRGYSIVKGAEKLKLGADAKRLQFGEAANILGCSVSVSNLGADGQDNDGVPIYKIQITVQNNSETTFKFVIDKIDAFAEPGGAISFSDIPGNEMAQANLNQSIPGTIDVATGQTISIDMRFSGYSMMSTFSGVGAVTYSDSIMGTDAIAKWMTHPYLMAADKYAQQSAEDGKMAQALKTARDQAEDLFPHPGTVDWPALSYTITKSGTAYSYESKADFQDANGVWQTGKIRMTFDEGGKLLSLELDGKRLK